MEKDLLTIKEVAYEIKTQCAPFTCCVRTAINLRDRNPRILRVKKIGSRNYYRRRAVNKLCAGIKAGRIK